MKRCKSCGSEKPFSEFFARKASADGLQHYCRGCAKARTKQWRDANPDRRSTDAASEWRAKHPDRYRELQRDWYRRHASIQRERARQWHIRNPVQRRAAGARKRATKLSATPSWANKFFIEQAYDLAKKRTEVTGIKWHVDHIVPLKSPLVCGLHVEHNLAVIPAVKNISKGNRYWPDMPSDQVTQPPQGGFFIA